MCLDSFSVEALKEAIEVYPGRPIINSISLEEYSEGLSKQDAVPFSHPGSPPGLHRPGKWPKRARADIAGKIRSGSGDCHRGPRKNSGVTPDQLLIDVNAYPIGQ